jgi:hypothetical protein
MNDNDRVYAGELASDANTQYILIKSDSTPTNVKLTPVSTPSPLLTRHCASDFSADTMLDRDPVVELIERKSTVDRSFDDDNNKCLVSSCDTHVEPSITSVSTYSIEPIANDSERYELELAIQRSLDDQHIASTTNNNDLSNSAHSDSSDTDGSFDNDLN